MNEIIFITLLLVIIVIIACFKIFSELRVVHKTVNSNLTIAQDKLERSLMKTYELEVNLAKASESISRLERILENREAN